MIDFLLSKTNALFAWLINHQPAVLFSQNKPATSNQPAVLFSQNKLVLAISHQPTVHAVIQWTKTNIQIFICLKKTFFGLENF
jgi:hypothetical protein